MKNVCAWTGGRAVLRPSGLVAAFPFPVHCSFRLLSSTLVFFSRHFSPMAARVTGRGLPRSLTPAQLWRKCPVQTCVRPETALHFSSRVLRASPCAPALKSAARVQLQLCSVASQLLLPHLPAAHYHVHFLGYEGSNSDRGILIQNTSSLPL